MPEGLTLVLAVLVSVSAPLSGWIAFRRDRPALPWFVFGALSGPFALAVLLAAPPGACPRCDTAVAGWPASCGACGRPFRPGTIERAAARGGPDVPITKGVPVMEPRPPTARGRRRTSLLDRIEREPTAAIPELVSGRRMPPSHPEPAPQATAPVTTAAPVTPAAPATLAAPSVEAGLHIVASGIFTGGSAHLEIGYRYGIGRDGDHLVVVGPVDQTPMEVRASMPLDTVDLLSIDDRVTVASRGNSRGRLAMAFSLAAGIRGKALEEALADVTAGVAAGDPG